MESTECVRVAVNIRPLITPELLNGCTDCITVAPKEPQVIQLEGGFFFFSLFCESSSFVIRFGFRIGCNLWDFIIGSIREINLCMNGKF